MLKQDCPAVDSGAADTAVSDTAVGRLGSVAALGGGPTLLLAQTRPQPVSEAVEKAALAISRRQGEWGVDGAWSYEFSKLGYAGAATSHSGAKPQVGIDSDVGTSDVYSDPGNSSSVKRCDVLKDSFDRVLRSRGGGAMFRVLDLGSGSGDWLLQAKRQLEEKTRRESLTVHIHGVTGDALPSGVGARIPSKVKKRSCVEVEHFQQIGIETLPLLLGGDIHSGSKEQHVDFKHTIEKVFLGGNLQGKERGKTGGYDLIVSSWTFCHLMDPLATLELWSNALAVEGELYVNDIDFSVLLEGEGTLADLTCAHRHRTHAQENLTGVARPREHQSKSTRDARSVEDDQDAVWERDPERRMESVFTALKTKGEADHAFSIEFVYDDEDYRTAVKVRRISAVPIRFAPLVGYCNLHEGGGNDALLDSSGRPVYLIRLQPREESTAAHSKVDSIATR